MYLGEKIVFGAFFLAAITCFWFSTLFHTFCCYDPFYRNLFSKLDYCGITILIIGSFVPWVYYGFYCDFRWKIIYLTGVCFLGAASVIVSWWEKFSKPEWRLFRTGVFMTFSLAGLAPAIHFGVREGCHNYTAMKTLIWLFLMGTLHLVGAVFYTIRVPERFCPGKFDIWLSSHQIFHVFVLAGALVHYHGVFGMATERLVIGECEVDAKLDDINLSELYIHY